MKYEPPKLIVNTPKTHRFLYLYEGESFPLELARSGRSYIKYHYTLLAWQYELNLEPGYTLLDLLTGESVYCGNSTLKAREAMFEVRVKTIGSSKVKPLTKPRTKTKDNQYLYCDREYLKQQEKVKQLLAARPCIKKGAKVKLTF